MIESASFARDDRPWPSALTGWSAVAVFCAAAILSYTDRQILSLLVEPIRADLNIGDTEIGLLQGIAFAVVYSFAGIPFGRLADRVSRRSVILAGVAVWSAGTILCGLSTSFSMMFVSRLIVGIGEAALAPAAVSMIADLFPPRRRGLATGTFMMGMVVGGGVAIAVGGAILSAASAGAFAQLPLLGALAPWRLALVLLGVTGLPLFIAILLLREPVRRGGDEAGALKQGELEQLRQYRPLLLPLILGCGMMAVGDFALFSWAPALLERNYGLEAGEIGATLGAILIVTGVVGTMLSGYISDLLAGRFGPSGRVYVAIAASLVALPGSLLWMASSPFQLFALLSIWSLFSSMAGVAGIMAVQSIVPNNLRGLGVSLIAFANIMLGLGIGTTLAGFLSDKVFADPHSLDLALTLCVTPAACIAVLGFITALRKLSR